MIETTEARKICLNPFGLAILLATRPVCACKLQVFLLKGVNAVSCWVRAVADIAFVTHAEQTRRITLIFLYFLSSFLF